MTTRLVLPMPHEPRLVRVASLVADATRARMLCFLLSGELASAGELARAGSVTPATASGHLAKLLDAGLVACEQRGRHRYYRLADAEVAHALEALALVAERASHGRLWSSPARARLREARCCYGHLAGRLGVGLRDRLVTSGWLVEAGDRDRLTREGAEGLDGLGFDGCGWATRMSSPEGARLAYPCLDWSERRDHLAGRFASALLDHFVARGWLSRSAGDRALAATPEGRRDLVAWIDGEGGTAQARKPAGIAATTGRLSAR